MTKCVYAGEDRWYKRIHGGKVVGKWVIKGNFWIERYDLRFMLGTFAPPCSSLSLSESAEVIVVW
jgi:hypothetical protein